MHCAVTPPSAHTGCAVNARTEATHTRTPRQLGSAGEEAGTTLTQSTAATASDVHVPLEPLNVANAALDRSIHAAPSLVVNVEHEEFLEPRQRRMSGLSSWAGFSWERQRGECAGGGRVGGEREHLPAHELSDRVRGDICGGSNSRSTTLKTALQRCDCGQNVPER